MLKIKEIFHSIQGEGPFVGHSAVFIRLGGCNLSCWFCDTEFDTDLKVMVEADIMYEIACHSNTGLVVITGGEPFMQDFKELVHMLLDAKYTVQIETHRTIYQPRFPYDAVTTIVSPKAEMVIHSEYLRYATAFKYVVRNGDKLYLEYKEKPVYVQPMDEHDADKNKANMAYAIELCKRTEAVLSVQLHKLIGVE